MFKKVFDKERVRREREMTTKSFRKKKMKLDTLTTPQTEYEKNIYKTANIRNQMVTMTATNIKQTKQIAIVRNDDGTYGVIEQNRQGTITNSVNKTTKEKANEIARYLQTC